MSVSSFTPFEPHPLLRGAHAQTLAGVYLPDRHYRYHARPHRLTLDDGDQIVLHDDCPPSWQAGARVALLMHGLCGSHRSGYMQRIAHKLNNRGVRTFRLDLRGCGAGFGLARLPYHSGRSEDAAAALRRITELCPNSPTTLIGFSLSGNVTLKLLGEIEDQPCGHLESAIAVCPPINLAACCRRLQSGWKRTYDRYFARKLMWQVRRLARRVVDPPRVQLNCSPKSLWEFDDAYTAPVCGFGTAENYYRVSSSAPLVRQIRLPTLLLASRDDPMVCADDFDRLEVPPSVELHVTSHGGHLGFISRAGIDPDRRWMDWRIVEWVTAQGTASTDC